MTPHTLIGFSDELTKLAGRREKSPDFEDRKRKSKRFNQAALAMHGLGAGALLDSTLSKIKFDDARNAMKRELMIRDAVDVLEDRSKGGRQRSISGVSPQGKALRRRSRLGLAAALGSVPAAIYMRTRAVDQQRKMYKKK